jgi:hypothetical protein
MGTGAVSGPPLLPYGSWIIVSRATGKPVFEVFDRRTADAINNEQYEALTPLEWWWVQTARAAELRKLAP